MWKKIQKTAQHSQTLRIADLIEDKTRYDRLCIQEPGIFADFSKTSVTHEALDLLLQLAEEKGIEKERARMFSGDAINISENRAVLHTACRASEDAPQEIRLTLAQMRSFAHAVRSGDHRGFSGKAITDIVTIGIGGSTLGPSAVCTALKHLHAKNLNIHFVSNVEASALHDTLSRISLESTLFIISSKSFTTPETMLNAIIARQCVIDHFGNSKSVEKHFVALSTNLSAVTEFGIAPENMFSFRDYVGGRFSGWSAIGLPIMLMIGPVHFDAWLAGARYMDEHFKSAPLSKNLPVMMALIGIWHRNFCGYPAYAFVPYHSALSRLPAWLQQVDMESNGKSVTRNGQKTDINTGPIVFGEPGTDAQHSFFQWIHQSADIVPVDFIGVIKTPFGDKAQHNMLLAHLLAQSRALMTGQENKTEIHRHFEGNKPSITILLDELSPYTLGMLMAAYEHKIYVQGIIWDINSFDQFGVELGKTVAKKIEEDLLSDSSAYDISTNSLMKHIKEKS